MDLEAYKTIHGEFVELRAIEMDDAEIIYQWRTSTSGQFLNQPEGYSLAAQQRWMQSRPANEINYMIISKRSGEKVGMVAVVGISTQDKNAEVGRLMLAPEYLKVSNPYGLESLKICCNLIINEWGFHKIYGTVLSENKPMLKLQKYLGMVEEGVLKQQKMIHGKLHDIHLVALFAQSLNRSYLPKISMLLKSFRK